MYTLYKFHFLNGISEIKQLFDDILIIWPAPVYIYIIQFKFICIALFYAIQIYIYKLYINIHTHTHTHIYIYIYIYIYIHTHTHTHTLYIYIILTNKYHRSVIYWGTMRLFRPNSDSAELIEMSAMSPSAKVSATWCFWQERYNTVFREYTMFPKYSQIDR